jgi:MFS family permease
MATALVGALLLLPVGADGSLLQVAAAQALLGAGAGILQAATGGAILNAVPPRRLAMSSALFIAIIMLGSALGGNLGGTLMTVRQRVAEAALGPGPAAAAAAYRPVALTGALFLAAGLVASLLPSPGGTRNVVEEP